MLLRPPDVSLVPKFDKFEKSSATSFDFDMIALFKDPH